MKTGVSFKRIAMAGGAALVLAGSAIGLAGAQTPAPTRQAQQGPAGDRFQQYLDTLAAKLGVTSDRLRTAMEETQQELGGPRLGVPGQRGHGGPGGLRPGAGPRNLVHQGLSAAATAMGITPEQLRQELPGKTLADVARARNVDPATVATALTNEANARIDQAVQAGRLTADQAAQVKQRASQTIDQLMNRQVPAAGERGQGPRGPRAPRGAPGPQS